MFTRSRVVSTDFKSGKKKEELLKKMELELMLIPVRFLGMTVETSYI